MEKLTCSETYCLACAVNTNMVVSVQRVAARCQEFLR